MRLKKQELSTEKYDAAMKDLQELEDLAKIYRVYHDREKTLKLLIENGHYPKEVRKQLGELLTRIEDYNFRLNPDKLFHKAHKSMEEERKDNEYFKHDKKK